MTNMEELDKHYRNFMNINMSSDKAQQRKDARRKLERLKYLQENSFEFSTVGLDTENEPQLFIMPYGNTYKLQFLLNTFRRDNIDFEGPIRYYPPDIVRNPNKKPKTLKDDYNISHGEYLEQLHETMCSIGLEDDLKTDVLESIERCGEYQYFGIWTKIPYKTMVELARKTFTEPSEKLRKHKEKLDAEMEKYTYDY